MPRINYIPASVSFARGFLGPKWNIGYFMAIDLEKAKKIIQEKLDKNEQIDYCQIGFDGDWIYTRSTIYDSNGWHDFPENMPQGSVWAEPILMIFFKDQPSQTFICWKKEIQT